MTATFSPFCYEVAPMKWRVAVVLLIVVLMTGIGSAQETATKPNSEAASLVKLPADVPADAARYTVLTLGNESGVLAIWGSNDGVQNAYFAFNDRGRGPALTEHAKLNPDGTIASTDISGNDYLKVPVTEKFAITKRTASWKNSAEEGSQQLSGPAFYLGLNGTPAEFEWLLRAMLKNGNKLTLLPAGEARVERVRDMTVTANGKSQTITAYSISGLDLTPSLVWFDKDGHFFGNADGWSAMVRKGWEPTVKQLDDSRAEIEQQRAAELAKKIPHRPSGAVIFDDVNLFDSENAKVVPHQTVVVEGNKIVSVGGAGAANVPANAMRIDGRGKTLLPGLWDMHAHVGATDGMLNLAAGVTTVRDLANNNEELQARIKRIEAGQEIGTRIIAAGFMDGPGPYQGPTKVLAGTPEEARKYVDMYAGWGYPQIKIYSSIKPELVPVIIEEAHKHGMRVSGHIPAGLTAGEGVKLGMDEIQHINFVMLNFMPDVKDKTMTPARFIEPGKRAAAIDLNSKEVQDFIALLKEHHTTVDVTLACFETMFTGTPGQIPPGWVHDADRLPPQLRRGLLTGNLPAPKGMEQTFRDSYQKFLDMTKLLYESGIPLETGTDDFPGFALERELELHVKAGIPANKALQNATWDAAHIMKRDAQLGSITAGKVADMVLVDDDPTMNISNVRKVRLTMKDGLIYMPDELDRELGIKPRN